MSEVRLLNQYGNYLAVYVERLRADQFWTTTWKVQRHDWQEVDKKIKDEQQALCEYDKSGEKLSKPSTPILEEVGNAAKALRIIESQILFEISQYAQRNSWCHSGKLCSRGLIGNFIINSPAGVKEIIEKAD